MLLDRLAGARPCPCCAYAQVASISPFSIARLFGATRRPHAAVSRAALDLSGELQIDGVTIVDPRDGSKTPGMSVLINKGRITAVVPVGSRSSSSSAVRIDATGKFVVPGYNDMHSHVLELPDPSGSLALMLAEGVTGFRQMSGSPALLAKRQAGALPIGRVAPQLHETPGTILTPFNAGSPDAVVEEIRRQKAQGADFIKVGFVAPDVFFAALEEGRRLGIALLGHLQEGTDPTEATAAGFRSVEHLGPGSTVWVSCSDEEPELRADSYRRQVIKAPPFKIPFLETLIMKRFVTMLVNPSAFAKPADVERLARAMATYRDDKGEGVAERFVADGSWHVPTLVRLRTQEYADIGGYEHDEGLSYMPRKSVERWRAVTERYKALPAEMRATFHEAYPRQQGMAKMLADAGVRMLVGTDGGSFLGPGMTMRQEFKELSDAGIGTLDILRMATINAATYLGKEESMGTVESGKDADLVLLDVDPLADVANLHRIAGVVRAGFHYSSGDLDAMRSRVAASGGCLH